MDEARHAESTPGSSAVTRAPGGFPVVGVIGGGQLARMMQPPAIALGLQLTDLAESPDASAALVIPSHPVGDHTDVEAVRAFARGCQVVTFDHEHVPAPVIEALLADGIDVQPRPEALVHAQDKGVMRRRLSELGIPIPRWALARSLEEVESFAAGSGGWPVVAKTPRGGYDGKGVKVLESAGDLADWLGPDWADRVGRPGALESGVLLEELVPFTRELAVLVARSPSGQASAWPVVETVQTEGICTEVIAPAPGLDPGLAARLTSDALRIAGELGVTGVMAVEVFEIASVAAQHDDAAAPSYSAEAGGGPAYLVNELAMRPHNSGHWTIDGAVTSQFEQHLRAVLDLPLGDPSARAPWTVMANVLGGDLPDLYRSYLHVMAHDPGVKLHLYGKGVRPGRKIGHVNVSSADLADARSRARHAAGFIQGVIDE